MSIIISRVSALCKDFWIFNIWIIDAAPIWLGITSLPYNATTIHWKIPGGHVCHLSSRDFVVRHRGLGGPGGTWPILGQQEGKHLIRLAWREGLRASGPCGVKGWLLFIVLIQLIVNVPDSHTTNHISEKALTKCTKKTLLGNNVIANNLYDG